MFPAFPYPPPMNRAEIIADMQATARRYADLAEAAAGFLGAAFPQAKEEARQACSRWLECQIAPLKAQLENIQKAPEPGSYADPYRATPEMLVDLMTQRDRVAGQLEQFEAAFEKLGENVPGMPEIFRATALPLLESQRDTLNRQIEQMQEQLDRQQPPKTEEQQS
jgi:hypothetical protein